MSCSAVDLPRNLNMKNTISELSFPPVTHMSCSDAWFDSYGVLKLGQGAEQILDTLDRRMNDQILRTYDARFLVRVVNKICRTLTQLSNVYSYRCVR
jgi:hypothetical protein